MLESSRACSEDMEAILEYLGSPDILLAFLSPLPYFLNRNKFSHE
jgi:hypothetical protein